MGPGIATPQAHLDLSYEGTMASWMFIKYLNPRIAKSGQELIHASNVYICVQQMLKHSLMPILAEEVDPST